MYFMSRLTVWIVIVFLTLTSISLSQKNDSDSTEIALSFLHAIQDPANSQKHIENATELLKKNKSEKINDTYNYWYIKYFILSSQLHQADSLAKIQIKKRDSSDLRSAKFYNLLGASKMMQQNYSETSKYLQKCIQIYEENNQLSKAAYVKSNLANLFFTLTDFDSAFKYAHEAFQVLNPEVDSIHYRTVMGILSISEAKIGKYEAAKKHANNTLKLGKTQKDMQSQALAYYALGTIYLGEKKYAKSVGYFNKCLTTAQRSNFANMEHLAHVELLNTYTKIGDFTMQKNMEKLLWKDCITKQIKQQSM